MAKRKNAAFVVRRGRKPGVYYSWPECELQVKGFSRGIYQGYPTRPQAQQAWDQWVQTQAADCILQPADVNNKQLSEGPDSPSALEPTGSEASAQHRGLKRGRAIVDLTTSTSDSEDDGARIEHSNAFIDLTGCSDEEDQPPTKKQISEGYTLESDGDNINVKLEDEVEVPQEAIRLTPAQEAVVQLALMKQNVFLTGAAGSGKTATLKEILRRLKAFYPPPRKGTTEESKFSSVQVVAPTGIAALPLDGKTTYSFAGWNTDSLQQPMEKLCEKVQERVRKAMTKVQVIIIEEISMVENLFLERLNLLLQYVLGNGRPFGGKQVIFVGDFHQLPPVKPFEFCLTCGEEMARQNFGPVCESNTCVRRGVAFQLGEKWAFKAPVWKQLGMKHIKLEQIHRQQDTRFQDVLNKIRNGVLLSDDEWDALAAKKDTTFAVKLMSRRKDVVLCNERCLNSIRAEANSWESLDSCDKLYYTEEDRLYLRQIERKVAEHKATLKDHRLPTNLSLKVGAKVVLLANINPSGGLVNGSQGEVVKFVDTVSWPSPEADEKGSARRLAEQAKINEFQQQRGHVCPVIRFHNGKTVTIQPVAQESLRGPSNDKYVVCRAQIPLALAWAFPIHKSQGMTLNSVEVSSDAIFESGQLYVGLSRATKLEGLTVTGYSREQLEMDEDVLDFYKNAPWEDLGPSNVARSDAV